MVLKCVSFFLEIPMHETFQAEIDNVGMTHGYISTPVMIVSKLGTIMGLSLKTND